VKIVEQWMQGVAGLNAIVTGGGRGIGAAIAATLSRAGARVTILGRNATALASRVAAGEAADYFVADISDRADFADVLRRIVADRGMDILVNNAGAALSASFLKTDMTQFQFLLDINLMGPVTAMQKVLPGMIDRKFGRIINIASTAALKGYPYVSAYVAAKHALLGVTRTLALETARTGVTVNAVCPGFTDTDLVAASIETIIAKTGRTQEQARAELAKSNPMGRLVAPAEVADAVCWLAGRDTGAVTGVALAVSGGEQ
jgi:3-hydroxybutyrate dehydrogenase